MTAAQKFRTVGSAFLRYSCLSFFISGGHQDTSYKIMLLLSFGSYLLLTGLCSLVSCSQVISILSDNFHVSTVLVAYISLMYLLPKAIRSILRLKFIFFFRNSLIRTRFPSKKYKIRLDTSLYDLSKVFHISLLPLYILYFK